MSHRLVVAARDAAVVVNTNGSAQVSYSRAEISGAECAAVSPTDSQLVFVGSYGSGLHRSLDGGLTFTRLAFPDDNVMSLAISPADGAVYAGCEPSRLHRSRDAGESWVELETLRQIPSAPTWKFPPRPWTHHVRQIAPSPHDPDLVLAGIELGGIMRTTDGGETWQDHRPGAVRDCHGLTWHPTAPGRAYEAGGGGSAWSHDGGDTWTRVDDGRDAAYRHYTTAVAVDPTDPDTWYVTAAPTPWQTDPPKDANAAIYRWRGDGPWEALEGGLPQPLARYPFSLSATSDTLFAGFKDGQLWAGRDRAERWERLDIDPSLLGTVRWLVATPV